MSTGPDGKKLKPCCACPETRVPRDECIAGLVSIITFYCSGDQLSNIRCLNLYDYESMTPPIFKIKMLGTVNFLWNVF